MRALITGVTGQDGSYLAQFLLSKGYQVYGTYRRLSTPNFWRLQYLNIFDKVNLVPCELMDSSSIMEAILTSEPDEVYNLAAQSFVGASFEQPIGTGEITGLGTTRLLECIRQCQPRAKFYQASTSELYGLNGIENTKQNENTVFKPVSPYAVAKLYSYWTVQVYREAYNIFACNGILFNHESPIRGLEFVTRKVTNTLAKIKLGLETKLELGNLESARDWGYAPEYVECMWLMLQQTKPEDYVIATGETHTIRELVAEVCNVLDIDNYANYIKKNIRFTRPLDVNWLCGDNTKAREKLNWQPKVTFKELVKIMATEDLTRWQRWQKGEQFAWDAPSYPTEARITSRMQNYGG